MKNGVYTGSKSTGRRNSPLSPGLIFLLVIIALIFLAPRLALGFFTILLLFFGALVLIAGFTIWRVRRKILKDLQSLQKTFRSSSASFDNTQESVQEFTFFSHDTATSSDKRQTNDTGVRTYEIDNDSVEVLDPEPGSEVRGSKGWFDQHKK